MVEIINYGDFYDIGRFQGVPGLESVVLFPNAEFNRDFVNSSVLSFDSKDHEYRSEILGNDVGCGITCFAIQPINVEYAADKISDFISQSSILGRGNHFIDVCGGFSDSHYFILIHSDGKAAFDLDLPESVDEAQRRVVQASNFRIDLAQKIGQVIDRNMEWVEDWPHNRVDFEDGKFVYRKGAIKVKPKGLYVLPANAEAPVLFYSLSDSFDIPTNSMPHGTGRKAPRSLLKATDEEVQEFRKEVYVPEIIPSSSLRGEHPLCYNDFDIILNKFFNQIVPIGELPVLAYIKSFR
ncbi:hypothetical protein CL616_01105 [archaeon]|nr:hypothetical protein [archaeon]